MADRMPNPAAVPLVDGTGRLMPEWVRWLQSITGALATATAPAAPAPPAPAPVPAPDPGPITEGLLEGLDARVAGLEQEPSPQVDIAVRKRVEALESDPTPSSLAARIARCERAIKDIQEGLAP